MIQDRSFYCTILRLSLPGAFQAAMSLLVVMADNLMVSSIDSQGFALAAVSQSNAVTNFFNAMVTGLAGGSIVLISQYWGKKDMDRIRSVCSISLKLCILAALAFITVILIFPAPILSLVINRKESEILRLAAKYLPYVAFSYLPFAMTASMIAMLKGIEIVRVTLYATIVSFVTNIGLNYVLIFGKLGMPALGVSGAAYATVLSRLFEFAIVAHYLFRQQQTLKLSISHFVQTPRWAWQDYAKFGLPVGLTDTQWALVGILKMAIVGQLGRMMINAANIADMMMNLGTLFTFALARGAAVVVGKAVGKNDYAQVREYSNTIQIMFLMIGVLMSCLVFLLRAPFVSLYGIDPATAKVAATTIGICAFTLIGTTYHASCFIGINRGAGDNRFVMTVDMICGWLVVLPSAALAAFVLKLPLPFVYFCTRIDQCFKWLIAFLRLRGDRWIHNVTRN